MTTYGYSKNKGKHEVYTKDETYSKKEVDPKIEGTILYENEEGTAVGVTLDSEIENFRFFEIESYVLYNEEKVYASTGRLPIVNKGRVHLNNFFVGTTGLQAYSKRVSILGTELSVNSDRGYKTSTSEVTDDTYTYITKVVGYE